MDENAAATEPATEAVTEAASSEAMSPQPPSRPTSGGAGIWPWLVLGVLFLGGLVITNILLLNRVSDLETELSAAIESIDEDVSDLASSVGDVSSMVDNVEDQLGTINALALASSGSQSNAPDQQPVEAVGTGLPRYDPAVPDPALGTQISGMEGPEYYSGETLSIDAADGKSRAWLVWAHWCPFCQEEMPDLIAWVETNGEAFTDFELVSVTTAMDESRGNPLVPYLDELELPFPVIVDEDGSLSNQLGLNAFPFWVFTGPDGSVLGRSAGLLGAERVASIFQQLQEIAASA